MKDLIFKWIGSGHNYGRNINFFCINAFQIDMIFSICRLDDSFIVASEPTKNIKTINTKRIIDEEIKNILLIRTGEDFRKKFSRDYCLLKFETENRIINVGSYSDRIDPPVQCHIICTSDFISLLADAVKIENADQLKDTKFETLACLLSRNNMTIELLKD